MYDKNVYSASNRIVRVGQLNIRAIVFWKTKKQNGQNQYKT